MASTRRKSYDADVVRHFCDFCNRIGLARARFVGDECATRQISSESMQAGSCSLHESSQQVQMIGLQNLALVQLHEELRKIVRRASVWILAVLHEFAARNMNVEILETEGTHALSDFEWTTDNRDQLVARGVVAA